MILTTDHRWVLAAPFRAHVKHLLTVAGLPWRALALHAGVEPGLVRALLRGRPGEPGRALRRLPAEPAARLLALTPARLTALASRHVEAATTTRRLRRLHAQGLDTAELAHCLQLRPAEVVPLLDGSALFCTARTALLAAAVEDARGTLRDAA
ncbi:hypothetical protein [Desertihabitans aurantiacus]|uniref:hypothetical protein n=1 Tax=Desertihabitans aurantiacus TaxID=2282477 RepID=UPI000DF7F0DE|nr:hypothetical protein [Desertihabitans aurantiacus]